MYINQTVLTGFEVFRVSLHRNKDTRYPLHYHPNISKQLFCHSWKLSAAMIALTYLYIHQEKNAKPARLLLFREKWQQLSPRSPSQNRPGNWRPGYVCD